MTQSGFDPQAAHRFFAAHCFNQAWELMGKSGRSPEEDRAMVALSQASLYHWSQRGDCGDEQRSIAHWQLSRIYALLGNAPEALRYAKVCLEYSRNLPPFYLGYAYEALARAESLMGTAEATIYAEQARHHAAFVDQSDERRMLMDDLRTIRSVGKSRGEESCVSRIIGQ